MRNCRDRIITHGLTIFEVFVDQQELWPTNENLTLESPFGLGLWGASEEFQLSCQPMISIYIYIWYIYIYIYIWYQYDMIWSLTRWYAVVGLIPLEFAVPVRLGVVPDMAWSWGRRERETERTWGIMGIHIPYVFPISWVAGCRYLEFANHRVVVQWFQWVIC